MQEDLKNVTEASPHTAFDSLVCAGMLPWDPGALALWAERSHSVSPAAPLRTFRCSATCCLWRWILMSFWGLQGCSASPAHPRQILDCLLFVFFCDYVNFPTTEWNAREWTAITLTPIKTTIRKEKDKHPQAVETLEPYTPPVGDAEPCSHRALIHQKVKLDLPEDPVIPLGAHTQRDYKQGLKQVFVHPCA